MSEIILTSLSRSELEDIIMNSLRKIHKSDSASDLQEEEGMNLKATAEWLGVSQGTVIRYKHKKLIPYYQLPNSRKVIFYKSELRKVFQQNPELLQAARK